MPLVRGPAGYRPATEGEEPMATLSVGPGAIGGFVAFDPDPKHTPIGASIAPAATGGFAIADRQLETGIGPLSAASDVRRQV